MSGPRTLAKRLLGPGPGIRRDWRRGVRAGLVNHRVIDRFVRPGMVAVDVGASNGTFSVRMLQLVGRSGHVYAVEPHAGNAPALTQIERRYRHFRYLPVAASDVNSTGTLVTPMHDGIAHPGLSSLAHDAPAGAAVDVPLRRLDDLLAEEGLPVGFVKVDVEGHERAVLAGAARTLQARPPILVEIEQRHHADPIAAVFDDMQALGYDGWALFERGLRPLSDFDVARDQERFLTGGFQDAMPRSYVNDFLFMARGTAPPPDLMASGEG